MGDSVTCIIMAILLLTVVITYMSNKDRHSRQMLNKWAKENGYQLGDVTMCGFDRGPFDEGRRHMWNYKPLAYKIVLVDQEGREHSAWAACGEGRTGSGLPPDHNLVIVVWDEEYRNGYFRRI
ncbi:MAG: hypothetical protein K8L91_16660 [Anaerolineae bacterium]|nr:hypothetical protein [Anaerolineae bacterium]